MITVTDVAKQFDDKFVVDKLNLQVKQGEIVGLLGPNGAGKTTTLRMLAGVLPPSKGTIKVDKLDMAFQDQTVKQRIGFLPENNPLYDELTVEEYLRFWADIKGVSNDSLHETLQFVVDSCGLEDVYYRPIQELSKGYRQRVGLAQAILTKPDILLLDEPTEGLDPNQRQDIAQLIRSLGQDRTVIISSHVLAELSRICNRMIIIHRGQVVADETPDSLKNIGSEDVQIVEFEVRGKAIRETLSKLSGVIRITKIAKDYYAIEANGKRDIRPKIFETAKDNNWTILTLLRKERQIEEVFSQLTSGDKS